MDPVFLPKAGSSDFPHSKVRIEWKYKVSAKRIAENLSDWIKQLYFWSVGMPNRKSFTFTEFWASHSWLLSWIPCIQCLCCVQQVTFLCGQTIKNFPEEENFRPWKSHGATIKKKADEKQTTRRTLIMQTCRRDGHPPAHGGRRARDCSVVFIILYFRLRRVQQTMPL